MERYELVKEIGSGNFGVAKLVRDKMTRELFAVKFIERGQKVLLTQTHLAIVMEYATGGELFERICNAGKFSENEASFFTNHRILELLQILLPFLLKKYVFFSLTYQARFFFQQLISGVSYCHSMEVCHRDLKLENTLLDGSAAPRVKICDFGYSKSSVLHSQPKSAVGTPAYIAPEVLSRKEYDGKLADVWSCGVTLYVMLVGAYPFGDPDDPRNFRTTVCRILSVQYAIPDTVEISLECKHLLYRIFVANPEKRITIPEIQMHPWFLKNLPTDLMIGGSSHNGNSNDTYQSVEEILSVIQEARTHPGMLSDGSPQLLGDSMDFDDLDDSDIEDIDISDDYGCSL
uniref:non-specific serine/threonine protein kinase n=1 Tax=Lactuca sativa TaxID=4236 RepID=A0A9R1V7X0_LACSA|nr:hypothetical protein LSAT_V11C600337600 [Lactuca sativa]